ncbi:MAG TPA: BamA/TamA family outer membrane protein, partial [Cytophagaceae bacterium]|nr:BamA/TamA family outer membrane protein [Cytophagaceae bacterium]
PVFYYSPETHEAIGITGLLLFKTNEKTARTSYIDFLSLTTRRKQRIAQCMWSVFTPGERFFIKGEAYYSKFPDYFYGIGNQTTTDMREAIRYKTFRTNSWVLHQLKHHLFFGPQYQFYKVFDTHFPTPSQYNVNNLESINGSMTSGVGLAIVYDTRNHTTNAHKGWYMEASSYTYSAVTGSEYTFTSVLLDIRKYIPLSAKATLALALTNNLNFGDVPFKQLAYLGGTRNMRGYYEGRFRDKNGFVLQAEYRQTAYRRWGFVIFGTLGNVYSDLPNLINNAPKYTVGAGLRFKINRKENTNLRVDEGVGMNTRGTYGNFGEAF